MAIQRADATTAIGEAVARHRCVRAAWVFGSVARGDATPSSDLDVAVLLGQPTTREDTAALRALSLALERFSPAGRVDIVVLGAQGPVFRHRVLREGLLVLDRDPDLRKEFEARTIAQYLDWKPTHEIAMTVSLAGINQRLQGGRR